MNLQENHVQCTEVERLRRNKYYVFSLLDAKVGEDTDPVAVPYRFNLSPTASGKCNVFKPTALPEDQTARRLVTDNVRLLQFPVE